MKKHIVIGLIADNLHISAVSTKSQRCSLSEKRKYYLWKAD